MITKLFNANTSKSTNFGPQDQQRTARLLRTLAPCLLALCSPEGALATPEANPELRQEIMSVANTLLLLPPRVASQSPPGPSRSSNTFAMSPPEEASQSPPDSPGPPDDNNATSTFLSVSTLQLPSNALGPPWSRSVTSIFPPESASQSPPDSPGPPEDNNATSTFLSVSTSQFPPDSPGPPDDNNATSTFLSVSTLQLPPDFLSPPWDNNVSSTPSTKCAPQPHISLKITLKKDTTHPALPPKPV